MLAIYRQKCTVDITFGARILSAVRKRPLLGGWLLMYYTTAMAFSIRNTASVRCSVGVSLSCWRVRYGRFHCTRRS